MPVPPYILKLMLLIFLISSMTSAGMALTFPTLVAPLRNHRLVWICLALSFLAAPGCALLLTHVIPLHPGHATGLLLLGCAAGAPFLPKLIEVVDGDLPSSVALMALLTFGTTLFLPLVLPWLAPGLHAGAWAIARPLLLFILFPLSIGMLIRKSFPASSSRWQPRLGKLASVSGLLMLLSILARELPNLRAILGSGAIACVMILTAALFALGYLTGGATRQDKSLMALATGSRNAGAAIVPAAQSGVDPSVMAMVVTGTVVMILTLLAGMAWLNYTNRSVVSSSHDLA